MCTAEGCPVAVEVFEGNVGDPSTLASQISKLKQRFDLDRVVLIGDRGMITEARIEETVKPAGLNFITALRAPAIRGLAEAGTIQLSLFDQRAQSIPGRGSNPTDGRALRLGSRPQKSVSKHNSQRMWPRAGRQSG